MTAIFFPSTFGTMFVIAGRAVRNRARLTAELHEAAVRAGGDGTPTRCALLPTSAAGSRGRCTTSSRTPSR